MEHYDEEYGDESCMMGVSYELEDGPLQCFNEEKCWQLGWYSEAHMTINITELSGWDSYNANITGAANFNGRSDQTVIIQINGASAGFDYYIAFNRKTGFNSRTREGGDKVLITNRQAGQEMVDSTLVAQLEDGGDFFIHSKDFKPNVVVHVNSINLTADPAYASLHISKYHKIGYSDSYCNDRDTCTIDTCVPGVVNGSIIFPDPENAGYCHFETLPCTECGAKVGVQVNKRVSRAYYMEPV